MAKQSIPAVVCKCDLYSIITQSFGIDGSDSEEDEEEIGCRHESANSIEDETDTLASVRQEVRILQACLRMIAESVVWAKSPNWRTFMISLWR